MAGMSRPRVSEAHDGRQVKVRERSDSRLPLDISLPDGVDSHQSIQTKGFDEDEYPSKRRTASGGMGENPHERRWGMDL